MKITAIEAFVIELPLIEPFIISYASFDSMPSVIVKITTDDGRTGYGEGVADEHVTGESVESVYHMVTKTLAPKLIGRNPMNSEKIHDVMNRAVLGAPTAKAALDTACFDLAGKALKVPAYVLLGGRYHDKFPITHVLSIDTPKQMADNAQKHVEKGYTSFKLKVGYDVTEDVERIKAVHDQVGHQASIRVDVNQGWESAPQTLQALHALQNVHLDWLEQPVIADDIDALGEVKTKAALPIMADEALTGFKSMREIIAKRAADKINIKLMKCGGMYPAAKLAAMAEMAGMDCQVGSMVESSIGSAAGLHVAFSKKVISSVELTGPLMFSKDIGDLHYDVPFIQLSERPGLGVDVDEDILDELTVYSEEVR
ncbi:Muconate cycloisomerase [Lentibacillus sp. JNUCC-1]|uniref:mandelate racemase/muconate lactonizing enzyme family protein n=1 Tax=Lentibacillus sp. JNUCC-1 TaxID=2654513 RepID=UPI0012E92EA1|nr:dipeptide epimerase [Lentibacillus sp. JNUCC-1]MUV36445.1 Muconate cycloisomerase [Lentibacillus sp. JNUCC-1]